MRWAMTLFFVLALGVMGCSETSGPPPDDSPYASKDLWLCRPDIENNQCDTVQLRFTEMEADGSSAVRDISANPDAKVDCFYIYHTVIVDSTPGNPGNMEELSPTDPRLVAALHRDGIQFREMCRIFAPLYHQMNLSTYWSFVFQWEETEYFERAYDDVVDAFEYYMRNYNDGRDFVLIGKSQGAHMLAKLLEDKFDNETEEDETLREQLVSALLIGPTSRYHVPEGDVVGGTFQNIPLCTRADETGCAIAFDSAAAGVDRFIDYHYVIPPGMVKACSNPASLEGGSGTLAALIYPRSSPLPLPFPDEVDTEWVSYPNVYEAECFDDGPRVLEIDLVDEEPSRAPFSPQELQEAIVEFGEGKLGTNNLHIAETYVAFGDLVRIVEQQIASRGD